jgi:hypothetical protein
MQKQHELLSGVSRIRREATLPERVRDQGGSKLKHPHRMTIEVKGARYILAYRKSRRHRMDEGTGCVRTRDLFCWILFEEQQVGALHLVEFKPDTDIDNDEFYYTMDAEAFADVKLAEVLCHSWHDVVHDVLVHGPVLEFRLAWMSPEHAKSAVWATAAEALIRAEFDEYSILVMKAFPLEYEGRAPEGSPAHDFLIHRQAAMIRYYTRLFRVDRFPGTWGADGWVWRANPRIAHLIPPPYADAWKLTANLIRVLGLDWETG